MNFCGRVKQLFFNLYKRNDFSSKYSVLKKKSLLGNGGNGYVRRAVCRDTRKEVALKCLNKEAKYTSEKKLRFEDEINTMLQAGKQIKGIIPIIDYSIRDCWYVMPIAESIKTHCENIDQIIGGIVQIAEALVELHSIGLSHRDIKPDNMLFYSGRWVLCDFGLVDIPDNPHNLTQSNSRIGAIKTIAPEMSRNAKGADGKKADVYSLAKSLWMLLTKNKDSFEGHYDVTDVSMSLHQYDELRKEHLVEIDELLDFATNNDPDKRPSMDQFLKHLNQWQSVKSDQHKQQASNWSFLKRYLFHGEGPQRCSWENPVEIARVMNTLSLLPIYSNLFLPDRGWWDYKKVEIGTESGCLDIYTSFFIYRVKLGKLYFESFRLPLWNYFLLEAENLEPLVGNGEYYEEVVEDVPGHFVSAKDAMYGVYDYDTGVEFPKGAKFLIRCLKGKFLIMSKLDPYSLITQMDDGRHANCNIDDFRQYVESLQKLFALKSLLEKAEWDNLYHELVDGCPFKPDVFLTEPEVAPFKSDFDFEKINWECFDFSDVIGQNVEMSEGKAKYRFIFYKNSDWGDWDETLSQKRRFLCKDGLIRKLGNDSTDIFEAKNRVVAISICKGLKTSIQSYCDGKVSEPYFTVEIIKVSDPDYIFTKEDIEKLMTKADDRVNNTLVIDEDGCAHIIQNSVEAKCYPVVHETWCERNKYVGRYSNLSELNPSYHYSLGKFRDYLVDGVGQSMDDYDQYCESEEELLQSINDTLRAATAINK